jgi:hypothetical protein
MVNGWFRQFRHVKMPENTKENDPQPSRSVEADPDFRTRLAASSDVSEDKLADAMLRIIAEGTAAATGDEFFRSLARCAAQALVRVMPLSTHRIAIRVPINVRIMELLPAGKLLRINHNQQLGRFQYVASSCFAS